MGKLKNSIELDAPLHLQSVRRILYQRCILTLDQVRQRIARLAWGNIELDGESQKLDSARLGSTPPHHLRENFS